MYRVGSSQRLAFLGLTMLLAVAARGTAAPVTAFNADVKEWSSSTVLDPAAGIYPIGGSGAVNGGFMTSTGSDGAQIGLRGALRFVGPLPQTNDGVTATYFAPTGTSGSNLSLWNFELDADLRGTGHTISDYTATFTITDRSGQTRSADLVATGVIPSNAVLYQNSENPGFPFLASFFPSFDPNAPGTYGFEFTLTPKTFDGDTLDARIQVQVSAVPEPATLLAAVTGGLFALVRRRKARR